MIKYTFIPRQPDPKRETAHRRIKHLGEHQVAFLNANNKHGFIEEPQEPEAWVPNIEIVRPNHTGVLKLFYNKAYLKEMHERRMQNSRARKARREALVNQDVPITAEMAEHYRNALRQVHSQLLASRSAAIDLTFAKSPLSDTEYFTRRAKIEAFRLGLPEDSPWHDKVYKQGMDLDSSQ